MKCSQLIKPVTFVPERTAVAAEAAGNAVMPEAGSGRPAGTDV